MRISVKYITLLILLLTNLLSCTPQEEDSQNNHSLEIYATGDDSSVRPDNDKDD